LTMTLVMVHGQSYDKCHGAPSIEFDAPPPDRREGSQARDCVGHRGGPGDAGALFA
jgi:hypothetical protein